LQAARIERALRRYIVVPLLDGDLASRAARHYRALRSRGITLRKTADLIIGTYCIERGHALLHDDRGFDAMATHLGLRIA
jgi:predicted nucleic acid-binding protein